MFIIKKLSLIALFSLVAFSMPNIYGKNLTCNAKDVAGTYLRTDYTNINAVSDDVVQLKADGTAIYLQGGFIIPVTTSPGSFSGFNQDSYGTWSCGDDSSVLVTTIGFYTTDNTNISATRYTEKIQFDKKNLDNPVIVSRQFMDFSTDSENLDADGNFLPPGTTASALLDKNAGVALIPGAEAVNKVLTRVKTTAKDLTQ